MSRSSHVAIVGGGIAGAITSWVLAQRGVSCQVLEASPQARFKVGETLPPNARPLLQQLNLLSLLNDANHLVSQGNTFLWGSHTPEEHHFLQNPQGMGWHLDRVGFEKQLVERAEQAGVSWQWGWKLQSLQQVDSGQWQLAGKQGEQSVSITADFIVDATGRNASVARRLGVQRESLDSLMGIACPFQLPDDATLPDFTYVESVPEGWWYAARLPQQRMMVVLMTDADLIDKAWCTPKGLQSALQSTQLIRDLIPPKATPEKSKLTPRLASSSFLPQRFGEQWLAVGDAAFAYDPISSYGLVSALGGGFYAGNAIADHFQGQKEALPAYDYVTSQPYPRYWASLAEQYRRESRWKHAPFWQRRIVISLKDNKIPKALDL